MRAIDGDELIKRLNLAIAILKIQNKNLDVEDDAESQMELKAYRDMRDSIKEMPTIEERKKGKWILPNNPIAKANDEWICSGCHYLIGGKHNYCPNCGADMRGEGHETD